MRYNLKAMSSGLITLLTAATVYGSSPENEYINHEHCGIPPQAHLDPTNTRPPVTFLTTKLSKEDKETKLMANWEGIWYAKKVEDVEPIEYDFGEQIEKFSDKSVKRLEYSCVDLKAVDLNGDNRKELLYLSPDALFVYENKGKMFELSNIVRTKFNNFKSKVRIVVAEKKGLWEVNNIKHEVYEVKVTDGKKNKILGGIIERK